MRAVRSGAHVRRRANVRKTVLERVRVTGLFDDVRASVKYFRGEGFRVVRGPNPLRDKRWRISSTRSGATLERELVDLEFSAGYLALEDIPRGAPIAFDSATGTVSDATYNPKGKTS